MWCRTYRKYLVIVSLLLFSSFFFCFCFCLIKCETLGSGEDSTCYDATITHLPHRIPHKGTLPQSSHVLTTVSHSSVLLFAGSTIIFSRKVWQATTTHDGKKPLHIMFKNKNYQDVLEKIYFHYCKLIKQIFAFYWSGRLNITLQWKYYIKYII